MRRKRLQSNGLDEIQPRVSFALYSGRLQHKRAGRVRAGRAPRWVPPARSPGRRSARSSPIPALPTSPLHSELRSRALTRARTWCRVRTAHLPLAKQL